MSKNEVIILVIEDNVPDYELLIKGLEPISKDIKIIYKHILTGKNALKFLYKQEEFRDEKNPSLIILDLNLPCLSGLEILSQIKQDKDLKHIPVIVFSTSNLEKDIKSSYDLYANSYITKVDKIDTLFKKILSMGEYWLKYSELPEKMDIIILNGREENENSNYR